MKNRLRVDRESAGKAEKHYRARLGAVVAWTAMVALEMERCGSVVDTLGR